MLKKLALCAALLSPGLAQAGIITTALDAPTRRALEAIQCAGLTPKLLLVADMTQHKDTPRPAKCHAPSSPRIPVPRYRRYFTTEPARC